MDKSEWLTFFSPKKIFFLITIMPLKVLTDFLPIVQDCKCIDEDKRCIEKERVKNEADFYLDPV